MENVTLNILRAINATWLSDRWDDADLVQIATAQLSAISGLTAIQHSLENILCKDLGERPPSILTRVDDT